MLLVPLSAVAAVALVNPDASAEPEEVAVVVEAETTTTAAAEEIVIPEIASGDDLELACGDQGLALVTKEADATISPLEQAALDSLRAICLAEGMELPGPPAPEAVVQTVTVVAAPASTGSGPDSDTVDAVDSAAAEFEAEYAATVAHINKAIDDGAGGEKIAKAERLVGEAAALADAGNYGEGMNKLAEARRAADEAERRHHDDDDDDHDEEDEEDEEDDDDDHDEEDEEDEEDEKDDH
jgi:hypothetical protein